MWMDSLLISEFQNEGKFLPFLLLPCNILLTFPTLIVLGGHLTHKIGRINSIFSKIIYREYVFKEDGVITFDLLLVGSFSDPFQQ